MKEFVPWYALPKDVRKKLIAFASEFVDLRHSGRWSGFGPCGGEESTVRLRTTQIYYDFTMPKLKALMEKGIKISISPTTPKYLDVLFIFPDPGSVQPADLGPDSRKDRKQSNPAAALRYDEDPLFVDMTGPDEKADSEEVGGRLDDEDDGLDV